MQLPNFNSLGGYTPANTSNRSARGPLARLAKIANAALFALIALTQMAVSQPSATPTGTIVDKFGDWSLLVDSDAKTVCFVATPAKAADAKAAPRENVFLYVSAWPKEGVKSELSARLGVKPRKGSDVTITVGSASFKMFAKDDRAFVEDPTRELKLIEAMKKGAKAVVQVEPEKGAAATDTFSLIGLGNALQALASKCP